MLLSPKQTHLRFSEIYAPDNTLLQVGHTGFDILNLILDKASRTTILFRYFGLIFTKFEKPTLH